MANKDFQIPIKGYSVGLSPDKQPPLTTGYMDNMFPRGTLEKRISLTQRPGFNNKFSQQIGATSVPVVTLLSVTMVD